MISVVASALILTTLMSLLALSVVLVRRALVPTSMVKIVVNSDKIIPVKFGTKLLDALASRSVFLPSACGGRGTCGQCRVEITEGAGPPLIPESAFVSAREADAGIRLACMTTVRESLSVSLPTDLVGVQRQQLRVAQIRQLTTYRKEITMAMQNDRPAAFEAGGYVLIEAPAGTTRFSDFSLDSAYAPTWSKLGLMDLEVKRPEPTSRAYSLANEPNADGHMTLVVRIALPPPSARRGTPPGQVSSYLFSLQEDDELQVTGPYGEFHARRGDREMILIGGGAGIAPLRSIVRDQLLNANTTRPISFWYGARTHDDLCYQAEFDQLARDFPNFSWQPALSEAGPDDESGLPIGFIHEVVDTRLLRDHPHPERAEYLLCGPPVMMSAVTTMLQDLGVDNADILFDDFGSQT